MKTTILLFSLLFLNISFSQDKILKIINSESKKEITIKENRRIRIKTFDGKKLSGKFKIFDETSIIIDNQIIKLDNIEKLKRHPLLMIIATDIVLISAGTSFVLVGLFGASYAADPRYLLFLAHGGAMFYGGRVDTNFLSSFKVKNNWKYEIEIQNTDTLQDANPALNP